MVIFNRIKKTLKWMVIAFFGSTILSVVALRFIPVYFTPLMFIRMGEQISKGEEIKMRHRWVSIDEISESLPKAVMASEDARFMKHHGFDFEAIEKAAKCNKTKKKQKLGASTISQQTAKNVFLWPGRTWVRKGLEAYFTVLIEMMWSKERIMEVYLNSIEMGNGIYGASSVAEWHFHCKAKNLSRSECALIAASLPNPRRFDSAHPTPYMRKRQAAILRGMRFVSMTSSRESGE